MRGAVEIVIKWAILRAVSSSDSFGLASALALASATLTARVVGRLAANLALWILSTLIPRLQRVCSNSLLRLLCCSSADGAEICLVSSCPLW